MVTAPCRHWNGTARGWCGATPTRRYLAGDRCERHAPAAGTVGAAGAAFSQVSHGVQPLAHDKLSPQFNKFGADGVGSTGRPLTTKADALIGGGCA